MFKYLKVDKFQYLFLFFISFILFEGWFCKYSAYRINIEGSICQKYFKNFWSENGFIETSQVIFILSALTLSIFISLNLKIKFEKRFLYIISICLFYYLGEEISWGQHYINFETPEALKDLNNQKEFNLHNISNLFDQLPRTIVFLICGFSFIFFYLNIKFFILNKNYNHLILPKKNLTFVSLILLLVSFPDFIDDKFNLELYEYFSNNWGNYIGNKIYEMFTLNYIRLSELQELIFTFYFLNYMIALKYFYSVTREIN